jgi:SsrA-binding protein
MSQDHSHEHGHEGHRHRDTAHFEARARLRQARLLSRGQTTFIENKKINFDYEVLEKYEAGIELIGTEVKSLRGKKGSLLGSYVTVRGGEAYLINSFIPPYQEKNAPKGFDPLRNRRLLLTKAEVLIFTGIEQQNGLTIVPISMYNSGRSIKVALGIVKGKKKFDKRQDLKKRADKRHIERTLKYE